MSWMWYPIKFPLFAKQQQFIISIIIIIPCYLTKKLYNRQFDNAMHWYLCLFNFNFTARYSLLFKRTILRQTENIDNILFSDFHCLKHFFFNRNRINFIQWKVDITVKINLDKTLFRNAIRSKHCRLTKRTENVVFKFGDNKLGII